MGKLAFRKHISVFFLGEYFSDAVRNTLSVVLPIALFFYLGKPETAMGIGIGTLLISLTDLPDHRANKIRVGIYSILLFFFSALIVSGSLSYPHLTAIILIVSAFVYSMFYGLGQKMGLVGTMTLALCTFIIGLHPNHPMQFSLYVLIGGCWYYALSLVQVLLKPYRSLHHAIFECLMSSAAFLRSKAAHYNPGIPLESLQSSSIRLHIRVNQRHELMRQLLLTDRFAMNPGNPKGQLLLNRAGLVIDLYEQLSAVHYDYQYVRKELSETNSLSIIEQLIEYLAVEMEDLSGHFGQRKRAAASYDMDAYQKLKDALLASASKENKAQQNILLRITANTDGIARLIQQLRTNLIFEKDKTIPDVPEIVYPLFITPENTTFKQLFTFSSPIFRFAIRLASSFLFAYILLSFFKPSPYSYWVFLTILIVARPRFSLTWKRNIQRVLGTLPGVVLGLLLLYFVKVPVILFSLSVIFLLGFYAFNRLNYGLCVGFITAAVILTLGSLHGRYDYIFQERLIYTLFGCSIAVIASYLFPVWDSSKLEQYIRQTITASNEYLNVAVSKASNALTNETQSRMARKNAHLSLMHLSDAIGAAKLEPVAHAINFTSLQAIQFLVYQIGALTTAIFLSSEKEVDYAKLDQINYLFTQLTLSSANKKVIIQDVDDKKFPEGTDGISSIGDKLEEISTLLKALSVEMNKFKVE